MSFRKKYWLSFAALHLVSFAAGILLREWLLAVFVVFVVLALYIHAAFDKKHPILSGGYAGVVAGLGASLVFLFFG